MSYDPTIGRFLSEDPIAFDAGDANLYRYVKNDPQNRTDPTGYADIRVYPPGKEPQPPNIDPAIGIGIAFPPYEPPTLPASTQAVLDKIYPIGEATSIWDWAPEGCDRWATEFGKNLRRNRFSDPNLVDRQLFWEPSNAFGGGHATYKFLLKDGTIITVDHWVCYGGTRYRVTNPTPGKPPKKSLLDPDTN